MLTGLLGMAASTFQLIDEWLENNSPNTRRAVTEGLRIWTSRP